jgi:hypothetical protein
LTFAEVLSVDRMTEAEPAVGAPTWVGPAGQPPKPGPPTSPASAIVTPCRLAAASVCCHDSRRSPPPFFAICATAGSVKT